MSRGLHWSDAQYAIHLRQRGQPLPSTTAERDLLAQVRRLALTNGFLFYHTYNSQRSDEGFPDCVLTNGTRVLFYELKAKGKKPDEAQERWLQLLAHTGKVECGVWRPADFPEIVRSLTT